MVISSSLDNLQYAISGRGKPRVTCPSQATSCQPHLLAASSLVLTRLIGATGSCRRSLNAEVMEPDQHITTTLEAPLSNVSAAQKPHRLYRILRVRVEVSADPQKLFRMADQVLEKPSLEEHSYKYPFAAAPDIIRSHQKDVYFEGVLLNHLANLLRRLYGARFLNTYTTEAQTFSELLYLGLTTFIGNRTLGEEYCDILQVEDDTLKLADVSRRTGYILTSVLLPYGMGRMLPSFRNRIRINIESNLQRLSRRKKENSFSYKIQSYFLEHLSNITSPYPTHLITLTIFYFSGAYYQLSKRIFGLRYIFTKRVDPSEARVGYEVLGVLLLLQMTLQTYLHLQSTVNTFAVADATTLAGESLITNGGVEFSLDPNADITSSKFLSNSSISQISATSVGKFTCTEVLSDPRYDLRENVKLLGWIKGKQQRKCTLCLEELKDPSLVLCGHVFCWACIRDWVREKPECPLCRRQALIQHILPLRA